MGMRRRYALVGLTISALIHLRPLNAAQRSIGLLVGLSESNSTVVDRLNAFREALAKLGWTAGKQITIEYRIEPDTACLKERAAELVERGCEVIVAWSTPEVLAAMAATKTIPIVFFAVADPIGSYIVQSLTKPGGNVTGATNFEPAMGSK